MNADLLSRIEDASLNASAPPQQRWLDGWLVRFSPGKAKRARCVNAVAPGRLPVADKLRLAQGVFDDAGLPLVVRITPFSQPEKLDDQLQAMGMRTLDDARVMVGPVVVAVAVSSSHVKALPPDCHIERTDAATYANVVGGWRGSPLEQRAAQAQRQALSPVPYEGWLVKRGAEVLACGQFAREADLVGLYDVFTAPQARGQGLASALCAALLRTAAAQGAVTAYLQVEANNTPARAVYHRLGFVDGYSYHYRTADPLAT